MHLKILNSKESKELHIKLKKQFSFDEKLDYAFLKSNKGKFYAVTKDIANIDYENLRIDSMGNYFAAEEKNGEIRLSIEGSQMIGPGAKENILELDREQFVKWFKGEDLDIEEEITGFQIVKHNNDFIGTGRAGSGKLRNFIPKTRRITSEMH